jgi:hypothetical protein
MLPSSLPASGGVTVMEVDLSSLASVRANRRRHLRTVIRVDPSPAATRGQ